MARLSAAACAGLCLCALLTGCGDSRPAAAPVGQPAAPLVFRAVRLPLAAITVRVPLTWSLFPGRAPLVATANSGPAVVAIWRYPRANAPAGGSQVRVAQRKLIAQARARDPQLRLISSRIIRVDGVAAVELRAIEQIGGHAREVSSLHVFRPRAELVVEEYAPPSLFNGLDRTIFSRVRASLTLSAAA